MYLQLNIEQEPTGVLAGVYAARDLAAQAVSTGEKHKHHRAPLPDHIKHLP